MKPAHAGPGQPPSLRLSPTAAPEPGAGAPSPSGEEFQRVFENAPVGIFLSTVQGQPLRVNACAARLFGYASVAEFLADTTDISQQLFVFPEQRQKLVREALGSPDFVRAEVNYRHKDGSTFLAQLHMRAVRESEGGGALLEGFMEDITLRKQAEVALQESEARFRMLFESAWDAIFLMQGERFVSCNPATVALFGAPECELLGKTPAHFSPPFQPDGRSSQEKASEKLRAALAGASSAFEWRHRRADGTEFDAEVALNCVNVNGQALLQAIVRDITGRKRAEAELRRNNRTLHMLSECNHALVHALEETELFQAICRLAVDTGGYRMAWVGLVAADETQSVRPVAEAGFEAGYLHSANIALANHERGGGPVGTAIRTGQPVVVRNTLTDPAFAPWREAARQRGYAGCAAFPLKDSERVLGALAVYAAEPDTFNPAEVGLLTELANDIAYGVCALRTRLERERVDEELHRLSAHLLQVRDQERRRLARDLHDTTAQHLAALSLNLNNLKTLLPPTSERALSLCADSLHLASRAAQEIRTHAYLLHPPLLEALGLVGAVEEYVGGFSARSGIAVEVHASAEFGRLPDHMELALFRVVQESLGNVLKHAHSPRAIIRFTREPALVRLEVQDMGRGIPAEKLARIQSMSGGCGVGLGGMHERLRLLGGRLEIQSSEAGTTVRVLAPLPKPAAPVSEDSTE